MLKKIFKWLYLLLSGMSFLLILCLFAFCGYVYIAEDEVKLFLDDFQEYRAYKQNDKIFEVLDIDEDLSTVYAMSSNSPNKKLASGDDPKLKIKTKNGYAYIRPSQIYYIESGIEFHKIVALNGKEIRLNKRETPLKQINQLLSNYACFYGTKSFIVNCLYIEQIERNSDFTSSKTFIIMENGQDIPLPENHVSTLMKLLDEIHETN